MKTAIIQFNASNNKADNVKRMLGFIDEAIHRKAEFICLPEVFIYRGPLKTLHQQTEIAELVTGPTISRLRVVASKSKAAILAGSIYELSSGTKKVYNTSVLINGRGQVIQKYRKINLFNAVVGKQKIRESDTFLPGKSLSVAKLNSFQIGMSICYDLRFSDLYRKLRMRGVNVMCVPSSFTHITGKAHWENLLRARAIENLSYVIAPNQIGTDFRGIKYFGNSMLIDPWGEILARASSDKEEIIMAQVDKKKITEARKKLPMLFGKN